MNAARDMLSRVIKRQLDAGAEPITAREAQPVPFDNTHAREPYVRAFDLPATHPVVFVTRSPGSIIDLAVDADDVARVRSRYSSAASRAGVAIHTSYRDGVLTVTLAGD